MLNFSCSVYYEVSALGVVPDGRPVYMGFGAWSGFMLRLDCCAELLLIADGVLGIHDMQ